MKAYIQNLNVGLNLCSIAITVLKRRKNCQSNFLVEVAESCEICGF